MALSSNTEDNSPLPSFTQCLLTYAQPRALLGGFRKLRDWFVNLSFHSKNENNYRAYFAGRGVDLLRVKHSRLAVIYPWASLHSGFPGGWLGAKESACQCRRHRSRCEFDLWVTKIPWCRKWQPTSVFLPGEFHGRRSLARYSPWDHKELDTTEHTLAHPSTVEHAWCHRPVCKHLVLQLLFLGTQDTRIC